MTLLRDLVSARTWLAMTGHLAGLVIGFASFCVIGLGAVLGVSFLWLALAGLPLLGASLRLARWLAAAERARFGLLLGAAIEPWPEQARARFRWGVLPSWRVLREGATWAEVGYALVRPFASIAAVALTVGAWSAGLALAALPLYDGALPAGGAVVGGNVVHGPAELLAAFAVGAGLLVAAPQVCRGLAAADLAFARALLSPRGDLAARVSELEASRDRVVDAAEAERRRIERDLHDGAQQRLVALAMELGRAREKFDGDTEGARLLVDQAHAQAKDALAELRDLVRGVHPPVLTDRGLDAALSGLAAVCPVPVQVRVDMPVRPKPAVEAVAYFLVAEALTNVAKHSRASEARVIVEGKGFPGTLTVMVSDDGVGGADAAGAGLTGLADRLAGVDGRLSVESPPGGPTIIAAVLPCA